MLWRYKIIIAGMETNRQSDAEVDVDPNIDFKNHNRSPESSRDWRYSIYRYELPNE